ncbi:transglutaminase domain-containing protein [Cohnella suwonensis]|uniref:Transglutaminase domain-containing protein n=1 Tax=Cohnella suwonensis TaxID=696072 RepID=A0ABW0LT04_9BACL
MNRKLLSALLCLLLLLPAMPAARAESAPADAITVDELAKLYFGEDEPLEGFKIEREGFDENTPNYVNEAFLYGLIDGLDDLNRTMTRSEAAKRIARSLTYVLGRDVPTKDFGSIKPADFHAVANVLNYGVMEAVGGNFEPSKPFTLAQAEKGAERYSANNIRGILPRNGENRKALISVGSNYAYMDFESKADADDYIRYHLEEITTGVKLSGSAYQRVDIGFAILELWAPDYEIKFTFKSGLENIRFRQSKVMYGTFVYTNWDGEGYVAEARVMKPGETAVMTAQPDSVHKKLYAKADLILKKIVKPGMTDEQKVKAIFDYVVAHVKYSKGTDYVSGENALEAIDAGKGVCVHYASLFHYLAMRAGIPDMPQTGNSIVGQHAWNMVYVNGKWRYLDATLADGKKTVDYAYYLKDAMFMMNSREWSGFGYPDVNTFPQVDGMKLKTTEELRVFLLREMENRGHPKTIKFAVTNKYVDTNPKFLAVKFFEGKYKLSYDAKSKVYTLTKV